MASVVSWTLRVICGVVAARLRVVVCSEVRIESVFTRIWVMRGSFEVRSSWAASSRTLTRCRLEIGRQLVVADQPPRQALATLDLARDAGGGGQRLLQRPRRIGDALGDGSESLDGFLHFVEHRA